MTLDDLTKIYREAAYAAGYERAGIRAIVAALRDEMGNSFRGNNYTWSDATVFRVFHEILASDEVKP